MTKYPMGYVYDWRSTDDYLSECRHPLFAPAAAPLRDAGKGKRALLFQIVRKITGGYVHVTQTIGDCASMGGYKSVDYLKCVEIENGEREEFVAMTASEPIYGYARVEVARNYFGASDGVNGASIVKALQQGGTLLRKRYEVGGKVYDFTKYSGALARKWGSKGQGVPDELEPTMREHPVRTASLATSWEEFRDALVNGYTGFVSSNQGFTDKRDNDGFLKPSGSWSHLMTVVGMDDTTDRPAVIIDNSWPPEWVTGPMGEYELPPGAFKVDAEVFEKRMLKPGPDSFIISGYDGYPSREELFDIF